MWGWIPTRLDLKVKKSDKEKKNTMGTKVEDGLLLVVPARILFVPKKDGRLW